MTPSEPDLTRTFQVTMILTGLVILIQAMIFAKAIIIPFMMAVVISIIFMGPKKWLQNKGIPGWLATTLILSVFIAVCFLLSLLVGNSADDLKKNIPEYSDKLKELVSRFAAFAQSKGLHLDGKGLGNIIKPESVMGYMEKFFQGITSLLANSFLILLTIMFILTEAGGFASKSAKIPGDTEKRFAEMHMFITSVQDYVLIKSIVSLLTGVLVSIALLALGVDYPFLWGTFAFGFNFIPNVGSIIAAIPPVLLAMVQLDPLTGVLVAACYLVINIIVGNFIEPRFMGKKLGLSTLVVFLSLIFWGWVFGPVGMLLSVILTMTIKIFLDSNANTRWLGMLLGPNPEETVQG